MIKNLAVALGALGAGMTLMATPAMAVPYTDTIQAPNFYFVPSDAQKYDSPYYRDGSQDWAWQHNAIATPFTTAELSISAFDVDYAQGEFDDIYAMDSGNWVFLGTLTGRDNTWEYGNAFTLGSNFFDDIATGLKVRINIDRNNAGWIVTLGKSSLVLDNGVLPPATPGVPEPGTWAMLIAGFGLVGATARRRRQTQVTA